MSGATPRAGRGAAGAAWWILLWLGVLTAGADVTAQSATGPAAADSLIFVTSVAGQSQIATIRVDASGYRRLTGPPGQSVSPVWSPDGRRIAFVRMLDDAADICVADADGGRQRRVTRGPGASLFPAWSPEGRHLAFERLLHGRSHLFVMHADGTRTRPLTHLQGRATAPAWAPDGRRIAFVFTPPGGDPGLYVMSADGGRAAQLVPGPILQRPGVLHPAWSPDGRRIAFVERVGRAEQQISVVNIDGTGLRRITTGYAPAWSPDGSRLAFVVARVGDAQVYVTANDGTARRLTPHGVNLLPAWSPDGRRLAFVSSRDGDLGIWVMNADGTGQRRLAPASGDLSMLPVLVWRPR